jgi:drug/metabolite transporter (DMT)-like permease
MKNHIYVLLSVFFWGISQYLVDHLLLVFSPALLILLRFLLAGLFILIPLKGRKYLKKLIAVAVMSRLFSLGIC